MKVTGSCHCGQIKYEADVDPSRVGVCNCTDCQVLTGSAFRVNVPSQPGTFSLLSGTPKTYVKLAASGNRRRQCFCPDCGAPVYASEDSDTPSTHVLRVGCLDRKAELPPQRRIWCESALPWSQDISDVPGLAAQ